MPQPVFGDDFSSEMLPGNKAIQVTTGAGGYREIFVYYVPR